MALTCSMTVSKNWTLRRTLKEKSPAQVINTFGRNVRFGGFTRENELFVSRLAMLGFMGTCATEYLTGNGALAQIDVETGLQLWETKDILILQAASMLGAASLGLSTGGKGIPDKDALVPYKKGSVITQLGLDEEQVFGFTENNELFLGRLAQLGFALSTIIESQTGKGPLAQLDATSGELSLIVVAIAAFGLFGAISENKNYE